MEPVYRLRASLRRYAVSRRVVDCGRRAIADAPAVVLQSFDDGTHAAHWSGVLRCGRQHSCPVCALAKTADRAAELDAMMAADPLGRWQVVTLTMRHELGEPLHLLCDELLAAFRRVRSRRDVRAIFDAHVTASVRGLESPFGWSGWHPHLHFLWRTSEWTEEEQRTLLRAWREEIGPARCASEEELARLPERKGLIGSDPAMHWMQPIGCWQSERAKYLCKFGAELAGVGKIPKPGHLSPWQIAERAAHPAMGALWHEYQEAMYGRRILEMDERARALADAAPAACANLTHKWVIRFYGEQFWQVACFEPVEPAIMWHMLRHAERGPKTARGDPEPWLRECWAEYLAWSADDGLTRLRLAEEASSAAA